MHGRTPQLRTASTAAHRDSTHALNKTCLLRKSCGSAARQNYCRYCPAAAKRLLLLQLLMLLLLPINKTAIVLQGLRAARGAQSSRVLLYLRLLLE